MAAIESLGEIDTPIGKLSCTLRAWESINIAFGSYGEAYRRVAQLDAAAMVTIVAEGSGRKAADVKTDVFKVGLQSLTEPLGKYLSMLSNGGKLPTDAAEAEAPQGEA